jgi:hypothetical protein
MLLEQLERLLRGLLARASPVQAVPPNPVGLLIGVLAVLSLGIRRDDHPGSFPADTDDG